MPDPLQTPVVLLLFNRPVETARVFAAVRRARPERLLLVADGPRPHVPGDAALTDAVRAAVQRVDWPCEVARDFADSNLGVGRRVSSGLDRAFARYEEAIVLEDDTLPDDSFFPFCQTLLRRYREEPRVMMVSGTNNLVSWQSDRQDYHFSAYGSIWGWASWRRAWRRYDYGLESLADPQARQRVAAMLGDERQFARRLRLCAEVAEGRVDTWDYQWTWSRLASGGLAAVSAVNLVSNIGFGGAAAHTRRFTLDSAHLLRRSAPARLRPPGEVAPDREYDRRLFLRLAGGTDGESALQQGVQLLDAGRNIHALLCFERALGLGEPPARVLFHQAAAYAALNRSGRAVAALRRLLDLEPAHPGAADLLARLDADA